MLPVRAVAVRRGRAPSESRTRTLPIHAPLRVAACPALAEIDSPLRWQVAFPRGVKSTGRWRSALHSARPAAEAAAHERTRPDLLFCSCMSLKTHPLRAAKLAAPIA